MQNILNDYKHFYYKQDEAILVGEQSIQFIKLRDHCAQFVLFPDNY